MKNHIKMTKKKRCLCLPNRNKAPIVTPRTTTFGIIEDMIKKEELRLVENLNVCLNHYQLKTLSTGILCERLFLF